MLTRLKVSGFKNLVDVDVRFGPFTCVAGANGVGKSNIFDAIMLLSGLAEKPLIEAAMSVRDEGGRAADVRRLFHRTGDNYANAMLLEAEMIVPHQGMDDFGQKAEATITTLKYSVVLSYREDNNGGTQGGLELHKEELAHIKLSDARKHLRFKKSPDWLQSAVRGKRTAFFISTEGDGADRIIKMHQDSRSSNIKSWGRGRGRSFPAATLPRTVLSTATNAAENPTAMLARREMQSWRLLQLEPSALRKPDEITSPRKLGSDGSHLPATLYKLAHSRQYTEKKETDAITTAQVYSEVANRLSELIDDVQEVRVDRDEKLEFLTLEVVDRADTSHPARSLSDGTLRFLALAVLGMDTEEQGLLCLEEPENGIHPERIPAMIHLLQNIATDTDEPLGPDNPLSQVIINTHSPAVVSQVPDDSLLVAELKEVVKKGKRFKRLSLSCLDQTWRTKAPGEMRVVSKGKLLSYLNPILPESGIDEWRLNEDTKRRAQKTKKRRVVDREDLQPLLPFAEDKR